MGYFRIRDDRLGFDFLSQGTQPRPEDDPDGRQSDRPTISDGNCGLVDMFPAVMIHRTALAREGTGQ
jgi:hypothetical protein